MSTPSVPAAQDDLAPSLDSATLASRDSTAVGELKSGSLGIGGITFLVVSAAAPLTVIAGSVPIAILIAGPAAPAAYLAVGAALAVFAVGFLAMAKHIRRVGGFYTYITEALGKHVGLGAGILALISYNAMQIGIYGLFAVNARATLSALFGVEVPWGVLVLIGIAAVWALGAAGIDIGAKVLGVLLVVETAVLLALAIGILVTGGGPGGLQWGTFSVESLTTPGFGATLALAFAAFIGFESTVLYRAEAHTPHRTVPRATYLSVVALTLFYFVMVWVLIQAYGEQLVQAFITDNGLETFLFATAETRLGQWAMTVLMLLIVTSAFAALLAFHNSINRYSFALARDAVLPRVLARTSARNGAPWVAGLAQTVLALVVTGGFILTGADPYMQLLIWANTPGTIGVILLQVLASVAVVVFFLRRRDLPRPWFAVPAAVVGGALMTVFTWLIATNIATLTMADPAVNTVILVVPVVAFLAGLVLATYLKARRPASYRLIGGQEQ
jgi:amino acid transporter